MHTSRRVRNVTILLVTFSAVLLGSVLRAQPDDPPPDGGDETGVLRRAPIDIGDAFIEKLGATRPGTRIPLALFDDVSFVAATIRVDETSSGFDWIGRTSTDGIGDVILSVAEGALVGTVWLDDKVYSIHGDGSGGYVVDEYDPTAFDATHRGDFEVDFVDRTIPLRVLEFPQVFRAMLGLRATYDRFHRRIERLVTAGILPPRVLTLIPESGSRVDILVATTAAADQWLLDNGYPRTATVQNIIAKANTTLTESDVGTQLHLLGVASVHYTESGDLVTDLDNLRGRPNTPPLQPPHPDLEPLHAIRDKLRADIVSLLVYPNEGDGRGQAIRLPGPAASDPTPNDGIGPFEDIGFNVVRVDAAVRGHSLTHEVSHNFGAAHDNYQFAKDEDDGLVLTPPIPGGHGFIVIPQNVRTVMAYSSFCVEVLGQPDNDTACPIIPRLSNSQQTYYGSPLGIAVGVFFGAADNAAVMNLTAQTVANFRHAYMIP